MNIRAILAVLALLYGQASSLQAFVANDRWNSTATSGGTGITGTPVTLTWSLADDNTDVPDGNTFVDSDLIELLDFEFGAGPGGTDYTERPWFSIFSESFDRLSELSGLEYVYEPSDDGVAFTNGNSGILGVRGDVRIGGRSYGSGSTTLAANFFPDYGEMIVNTDRGDFFDNPTNNFRAFRNTIMHETLHGVGISHVDPASPRFLMEPSLATTFDGPQLDDLLAMQRLYGDVLEKDGGNDTYSTATSLGQVRELQSAVIGLGGDNTAISSVETDFVSIDDNSDVDFFSFTISEPLTIAIDLTPKGASYLTGPDGGTVATLDTRGLSDLGLSLLASNGTTVLAASEGNGLGESETLAMALAAGTYYTRVTGGQNNIQLYQLTIAVADEPENLLWTGQLSPSWDFQGTANFEDSTGPDLFANLDTVTFDDTGLSQSVLLEGSLKPAAVVIDAALDYDFSGSGAITAGSLTINGTGTVEFTNSGNSYAGPTHINAGTLILSGDTSAMTSAITVADGATLIMDSNVAGENGSTFLIESGGTLQVGRVTSNADVFPNEPVSVINNGTIRIFDFESVTNVSGTGDVIAVAELGLLENNSYSGQTIVEAGASIQPIDDSALGSVVGTTVVEAGGFVVLSDDDFGPPTISLAEDFSLAGLGDGGGAIQVTAGTGAVFTGDWTIDAIGASMSVRGGSDVTMSGTLNALNGQATLDVSADSVFHATNGVMIGSAGLVKTSAGPATLFGSFDINGPVAIQAGTLGLIGNGSVAGEIQVASGATLQIATTALWQSSSSLTGDGTIEGDLTLPGTLAPGSSAVGNLTIDGDLTLTESSVLDIQIGGIEMDQFDQIESHGTAQLAGILRVELIDLGGGVYQPQAGDSISFLVGQEGLSGDFEQLLLPTLAPGLDWQLDATDFTALLHVITAASFTADFDLDGNVDGDDLTLWQSDFGGPGSDSDGDGDSDGADLFTWQRQFGSGFSPLAVGRAIPEPATMLLAILLAAIVCAAPRGMSCRDHHRT